MKSQLDFDQKKTDAGILLQRYLVSPPATAERTRDQLLQAFMLPLIRTILWRNFEVDIASHNGHQGFREELVQEVYSKILIALLRQLKRWHTGEAPPPPPEKFLNYVASATYNACKNAYPRAHPTRGPIYDASFQVYHLLTRQEGFALWQTEAGLLWGGYAVWKEAAQPEASTATWDNLQRDPEGFVLAGLHRRYSGRKLRDCTPVDMLVALLDQAGSPLEFSTLVSAFDALEKTIQPSVHTVSLSLFGVQGEDAHDLAQKRDVSANIEQTVTDRAQLRQLWEQILRLPVRQRKALLLNLQGADIRLLPEMGVAEFGEIASALEKTPIELARIWHALPLDDARIALELGSTAPKVKNLRQSAYDTLSWRIRPFQRGALRRLWLAAIRLSRPMAIIFLLYARDAQESSLLILLRREGYVTSQEIAERLSLPQEDLKRIWHQLPMRLDQIAALLRKPIPIVVQKYVQACEHLHTQLIEIRGEN